MVTTARYPARSCNLFGDPGWRSLGCGGSRPDGSFDCHSRRYDGQTILVTATITVKASDSGGQLDSPWMTVQGDRWKQRCYVRVQR